MVRKVKANGTHGGRARSKDEGTTNCRFWNPDKNPGVTQQGTGDVSSQDPYLNEAKNNGLLDWNVA